MENAVDAGADQVTVVIQDAGRTLIQVIDNGCGMTPDQAVLCFERHATSKLQTAEDLNIGDCHPGARQQQMGRHGFQNVLTFLGLSLSTLGPFQAGAEHVGYPRVRKGEAWSRTGR